MASPPTARRLPCALDAGGPLLNVKPANIELRPVSRYMPGAGLGALDVTARAAVEDGRLRNDKQGYPAITFDPQHDWIPCSTATSSVSLAQWQRDAHRGISTHCPASGAPMISELCDMAAGHCCTARLSSSSHDKVRLPAVAVDSIAAQEPRGTSAVKYRRRQLL